MQEAKRVNDNLDRLAAGCRKHRKNWLPFEQARGWARAQGLTSESSWRLLRQQGLPDGIPTNPNRTYAEFWQGWPDFLGNDVSKYSARAYRTLEEASQWARNNGITSLKEWRQACAENRIPHDIPCSPSVTYSDWVSIPDFLGQSERRARNRVWLSYEDARAWVRKAGFVTKEDWATAQAQGAIPAEIPSNPNVVYFGVGWTGWPTFLGRAVRGGASVTEDVIAHELSHFAKVDKTIRAIALPNGRRKRVDIVMPEQRLIIEYDGAHWHDKTLEKDRQTNEQLHCAGWSVMRIRELPLQPIGALDLTVDASWPLLRKTVALLRQLRAHGVLAEATVEDIDRYEAGDRLFAASTELSSVVGWRRFEDSMAWVRKQGISSEAQWRELRRSGGLPGDIPSNPDLVYAVKWSSWGHFLGTGREAVRSEDFVAYETAKAWARQSGIRQAREWTHANKAGLLPLGIPGTPSKVYQAHWEGWGPFLGVSDSKNHRRQWRPFEDARLWARNLALEHGIDSEKLWRKFLKNGALPHDIPKAPEYIYRDRWVNWGDWFGTGNKVGGAARWRKIRAASYAATTSPRKT